METDYNNIQSSSTTSDMSQVENQNAAQMQQIQILDESIYYIKLIIVGIFLSLSSLKTQRCQLLNQTSGECNVYPRRVISSIIILFALTYFYQLSEVMLCAETTSCRQKKSNQINNIASTLVLLASILRLLDLLCNGSGTEEDL